MGRKKIKLKDKQDKTQDRPGFQQQLKIRPMGWSIIHFNKSSVIQPIFLLVQSPSIQHVKICL